MEETRCRALEDYLAVVEPSGIDFGCGCAYEADNGGTPLPVNKFEPRDWPASRNSPKPTLSLPHLERVPSVGGVRISLSFSRDIFSAVIFRYRVTI